MNELYHHGIKGQKWGVRRYQNKDGSRISASNRHLGITDNGMIGIISGKTSDKGKKRFITRMIISVGLTSAAVYVSKHPDLIIKGKKSSQQVA